MHSGMVARFMFHEYIDHTYLPHPCGGFSVATKTFFLLSLHIAATSASHQKATLSNIISNRPNPPSYEHPQTFFSFHPLGFTGRVAVCFEVRYAVVRESERGKGGGKG